MNSLFGKILLWFWAALILNTIGSALISGLAGPRPYLLTRLIAFQLEEARTAYQTGGQPALEGFMQRFHRVFAGEGILTDASGHDVLTGADESALLNSATQEESWFPVFRRRGAAIARNSVDGKYWFIFVIPPARLGHWFLLPQHWWMMAAGVLLCYLLAYYLTYPVRKLERAVERFGRGDLSARAATKRRDELGELGRTFDRMADRIQMLVDAEHRLLLDISHELRSPLARLRVAVELARSAEDRGAYLDRIDKEAERLNSLVGGLLQVTRGEGDPDSLRRERVRLDELLEELVADASIEAGAHGSQVLLIESAAGDRGGRSGIAAAGHRERDPQRHPPRAGGHRGGSQSGDGRRPRRGAHSRLRTGRARGSSASVFSMPSIASIRRATGPAAVRA